MPFQRLVDKKILLCVTGSIAAYKACEVLRLLIKEGADVQVVMTHAAQHFVHPLTFETLSGHEVIRDLFPDHRVVKTRHVNVAEWADCILVCPATANSIGKMASGIADDFLSTAVMASRSTVLLAPAMDCQMVRHPIYEENCAKLKALGYRFIETEEGDLASGKSGPGRLAAFDRILDSVHLVLLGTETLKGKRVLITAGPTRESLDPVRYISNRSSGKMGFALAEEARLRGADVTLVSGPVALRPFEGIRLIRIETAEDMAQAVRQEWRNHHVLVMAAAVADYRPSVVSKQKMKRGTAKQTLDLEKTIDVLVEAAKTKGDRVVVGFALETENGESHALTKLETKGLDLICLNTLQDPDSGFETDTNRITLYDRHKGKTALPLVFKREAAGYIWDRIASLMKR